MSLKILSHSKLAKIFFRMQIWNIPGTLKIKINLHLNRIGCGYKFDINFLEPMLKAFLKTYFLYQIYKYDRHLFRE